MNERVIEIDFITDIEMNEAIKLVSENLGSLLKGYTGKLAQVGPAHWELKHDSVTAALRVFEDRVTVRVELRGAAVLMHKMISRRLQDGLAKLFPNGGVSP